MIKNHIILALETSVAQATMILTSESGILSQKSFRSERSQECDLFTPLLDLLSKIPSGEKLSAVVVGIGPGSYNGTRVGIATAQAIARLGGSAPQPSAGPGPCRARRLAWRSDATAPSCGVQSRSALRRLRPWAGLLHAS